MHGYDTSCFRRIPGVQLTRIYFSERILLRFARKTIKNFEVELLILLLVQVVPEQAHE